MALPSPLLPAGRWTRRCQVLPAAKQEVPSPAWRRSAPTSTPKRRRRWGAELGIDRVNRIRILKKGWISSFSAQGIRAETRRDLFSSLKQQKAAISYGKGFPLLLLRLPTGATLRLLGWCLPGLDQAWERRSGRDLLPFLGRKQQTGEGPREPLGFTSKGDEMKGMGGTPA